MVDIRPSKLDRSESGFLEPYGESMVRVDALSYRQELSACRGLIGCVCVCVYVCVAEAVVCVRDRDRVCCWQLRNIILEISVIFIRRFPFRARPEISPEH